MAQSSDELKKLGNAAFAAKDFPLSIEYYTQAIQVDPTNHVLFSNRSASYAGLSSFDRAAEDAKQCLQLDPTFLKGYYRLATAQLQLRQHDAAAQTVQQGLKLEPQNPQLLKQLQQIKQEKVRKGQEEKKKKQNKKRTAKNSKDGVLPASSSRRAVVDGSVSAELKDLEAQFWQLRREIQIADSNRVLAQREHRSYEITQSELQNLSSNDAEQHSQLYRSVGKMFVASTHGQIMDHLQTSMEQQQKQEKEWQQKKEYLEKRLQSTQQNIQELTKSNTVTQ